MEPTIYKPSIYKGAGIYKTGAEGGSGGGDFIFLTIFDKLNIVSQHEFNDTPVIGEYWSVLNNNSSYYKDQMTIGGYNIPTLSVGSNGPENWTATRIEQLVRIQKNILSIDYYTMCRRLNIFAFCYCEKLDTQQTFTPIQIYTAENERGTDEYLIYCYLPGLNDGLTSYDSYEVFNGAILTRKTVDQFGGYKYCIIFPSNIYKWSDYGIYKQIHFACVMDNTTHKLMIYADGVLYVSINLNANYLFFSDVYFMGLFGNYNLRITNIAVRDGDMSINGGMNFPVPTEPYYIP